MLSIGSKGTMLSCEGYFSLFLISSHKIYNHDKS